MNKEIQVVQLVADPYPPYQYMEGETVRGVDHDIIAAAFKEYGIDTNTRLLPWDHCIQALRDGMADGVFQIVCTPERERKYIFSKPLRAANTVFYKRTEDLISFGKSDVGVFQQLTKYRVGVMRGYSYNRLIDRLGEPFRIEVDSHEALLIGLIKAEFDLAIIDRGVAEYLVRKMGIKDINKVEGYHITRELHVAFERNRDEIADRFNSGLDRVHENGIYERIFESYGLTQEEDVNQDTN